MNNYEILGLQKGASISEVKKKFRALSLLYHPDMKGGNASKFIQIKEAYDALLKGDSGEQQNSYQYRQQSYRQQNTKGSFKFINIQKDEDGYLFMFFLRDVRHVKIYGKDGFRVAYYNTNTVNGEIGLILNFKDAESAEYYFKVVLEDDWGRRAERVFTVKPPFVPNWWQKILIKLKLFKH